MASQLDATRGIARYPRLILKFELLVIFEVSFPRKEVIARGVIDEDILIVRNLRHILQGMCKIRVVPLLPRLNWLSFAVSNVPKMGSLKDLSNNLYQCR